MLLPDSVWGCDVPVASGIWSMVRKSPSSPFPTTLHRSRQQFSSRVRRQHSLPAQQKCRPELCYSATGPDPAPLRVLLNSPSVEDLSLQRREQARPVLRLCLPTPPALHFPGCVAQCKVWDWGSVRPAQGAAATYG